MTKEEILEEYSVPSNQFGWCLPPDQARKAMDAYSEEVAIEYAYWLLEKVFSMLMERKDRESRKMFNKFKQEKSSLK